MLQRQPVQATGIFLVAALIAVLSHAAGAQQPTQAQANAIRQSCSGDYRTYCASVPTGGTAALQCLQRNLPNLSSACRQAVGTSTGGAAPPSTPATMQPRPAPGMPPREEAATVRQACGADFRALCRGVRLGGGRAIACLADHQESLSPGCRDALVAARGAR